MGWDVHVSIFDTCTTLLVGSTERIIKDDRGAGIEAGEMGEGHSISEAESLWRKLSCDKRERERERGRERERETERECVYARTREAESLWRKL